jgi:hypothetical protein
MTRKQGAVRFGRRIWPWKAGLSEVTQLGQSQVSGTDPILHRKQFAVASERSLRRIREELAGLSLKPPFEFPKTPFWQAQRAVRTCTLSEIY